MAKDQTAPGRLELVRAFVNSLDVESGTDRFGTARAAAAWLDENAFGGIGDLDSAELAFLRELREAIRLALSAHAGQGDGSSAWAALAAVIDGTAVDIRLGAPGTAGLKSRETNGATLLRTNVAIAVYEAIRDGNWGRLKACRKHSCLWAFYDRSKNGSGAWCNMAVCGNRVKAARRRVRERERSDRAERSD